MSISSDKAHEIILESYTTHADPDDAVREAYYRLGLRAVQTLNGIPRNPAYWRAIDQALRLRAFTCHFRGYLQLPHTSSTAIGLGPTMGERWFSLMDIWIELMEFVHDHYDRLPGGWPFALNAEAVAEDLQALHETNTMLANQYVVKNFLTLPTEVAHRACMFADAIIGSLIGEEQTDRFNEQFNPMLPQLRLFQRSFQADEEQTH